MTVTTAGDLLVRAHHLAITFRDSHDPVSLAAWQQFDVTLNRVLNETLRAVPSGDFHEEALLAVTSHYPDPLRHFADDPLTPGQAAQILGITERTVYRRIHDGHLRVIHDGDTAAIDAATLDQRQDITPADPADPHPLARLSVTLGGLADLLNHARTTGRPVLDFPQEAVATARQVLAIGLVAAGRTLAAIPYADADRPLLIAKYTERALDTLAHATVQPASLNRIRVVSHDLDSGDIEGHLEAVVDTWTKAATAELTRSVPPTEALATLASQAFHLYAVTHQVMTTDRVDSLDPHGATTAALRTAARAAKATAPLWAAVTTCNRPTLEYAAASRDLYATLSDITAAIEHSGAAEIDTQRAMADLSAAATTIADLMNRTRSLPERLAGGRALHGPKDRTTVVDLHSHRRLRTQPVTVAQVADLATAWTYTGNAANRAATQLERVLCTQAHPLFTIEPAQRRL